jgi:lipoprotein-anchoring transpeptidase ErfK/SrfK
VSDLDLSGVNPVFIQYTVEQQDAKAVGSVPHGPAAQAKLKSMPYRSVAEAVAEKFHCDLEFLKALNPGKSVKPGDVVTVPNVEPFELAEVKALPTGRGVNEEEDAHADESESSRTGRGGEADVAIHINTKTNMLELYSGHQLEAAFPVTVGSHQLSSPIGHWTVQRITKMPTFRYDPLMLQHGRRGSHYHLLPPGPNNPVGIMWIALNKKGIGIHGTDSPDTIGRASSHGCIRMANWDVAKLATMVSPGVHVAID